MTTKSQEGAHDHSHDHPHEHPHPEEQPTPPPAEPWVEPSIDALASDWLARELSGVVLAIGQAQGQDPLEWMVGRVSALNQAIARLTAEKLIAEFKVQSLEGEIVKPTGLLTGEQIRFIVVKACQLSIDAGFVRDDVAVAELLDLIYPEDKADG